MMAGIEVYTFENKDGDEFGSFTTQDINEARSYARENGLKIIANTFEWADSEEIEDYTPEETDEEQDEDEDEES